MKTAFHILTLMASFIKTAVFELHLNPHSIMYTSFFIAIQNDRHKQILLIKKSEALGFAPL